VSAAAKKVARRAPVKPANDAPIPFVPAPAPEAIDAMALVRSVIRLSVDCLNDTLSDLDIAAAAASARDVSPELSPFIGRVERRLAQTIRQLDRLRGAS
jgi:hypothetical protein